MRHAIPAVGCTPEAPGFYQQGDAMTHYDELSSRAERGTLVPTGQVLSGSQAANFGQQLLMEATNTDNIEDAIAAALASAPLSANDAR